MEPTPVTQSDLIELVGDLSRALETAYRLLRENQQPAPANRLSIVVAKVTNK